MTSTPRPRKRGTALHPILFAALGLGFVAATALVVFVTGSCGGSTSTDPLPSGTLEIAQIKASEWRTHIGETVEVRGLLHLNADGTGALFKDLDTYYVLGYLPESDYLPLTFENVAGLVPETHELSIVRIQGVLRETTDPGRAYRGERFGDLALCEVGSASVREVITPRWVPIPEYVQPCDTVAALCDRPVARLPDKFAILFCGGDYKDRLYPCFWNELVLYYTILTWLFGFDPDNITVVYKDGVPEDGSMPVHHIASYGGLQNAFLELQPRMGEQDLFFLFMTNHGGPIPDDGSPYPGDELGAGDHTDEAGSYWQTSSRLYDENVGWWVQNLTFGRMCCVINQCLSGGFIYDLRGPNRVICTSSRDHESGNASSPYSPFSSNIASALIGFDLLKNEHIDADEDGNGMVSIYEAFRWTAQNDTSGVTPQYEDSGEGISIDMPTAGVTVDGLYGSTFYL